MVTSPYEWKILKWDNKLQKNKTKPLLSVLLVLVSVTSTVSINKEKRDDPSQSLTYPLNGISILLITTNSSFNNNSLLSIVVIQYLIKVNEKKKIKITHQNHFSIESYTNKHQCIYPHSPVYRMTWHDLSPIDRGQCVCRERCLWPSIDVRLVYLWSLILLNFCCNWLQQSSWITKGIGSLLPQFIAVIVYRSIILFFQPTSLAMHVFFSFFLSFIACIYQYCSSSLFLINISLWNPLRFSFF